MKIETERLLLRPFEEDDLEDEFSILGDAETMCFYSRPYTREEVARIIAKNRQSYEESGYGLFAMIEKESGSYIGDCGITIQVIDGAEEFEVGYRVKKKCWGRGFAPEAARAMVTYGFQQLGLKKLFSYMPKEHRQSRRTAEKAGMKLEKEFYNSRNRDILTTVYSVLNEDA